MVGGQAVGIDDHPGRCVGVEGAAQDEDGLVGVALPLEVEDPVARHRRRADDADLEQFEEALVEGLALGERVEHRPGAGVLRRHPRGGLLAVAVLQPPVGVVDLGAVQHLDDITDGRRRGRRYGGG